MLDIRKQGLSKFEFRQKDFPGRRIFNPLQFHRFVVWKCGEVLSRRIILQVSKHRLQQRSHSFLSVIASEELEFYSRSVINC